MKKIRLSFYGGQFILFISLTLAFCYAANAQTIPSILQIDLENKVQYREDSSLDPSKFATQPGIVPANTASRFGRVNLISNMLRTHSISHDWTFSSSSRLYSLVSLQ